MWATESEALLDLRRLVSDSSTDKLCDMKLVFGKIDGSNTRFKTFERRRLTNFTEDADDPSPVGVYVNNERIASAAVSSDDPTSGSFLLASPPEDGDEVRATYYYQWFIDDDCNQFLVNACQWLGFGTNYLNISDGLQPAALHYAAQEAYSKLSLWFSTKISNQYMLDDAPDSGNQGVVNSYKDLAEFFHKKSISLRDNFYTRQGQSLSPLYKSVGGVVRDYVTRR